MRQNKTWNIEETSFLIENHSDMPYAEIASSLGRTVEAVRRKSGRLNLQLSEEERHKRIQNRKTPDMSGENNPNWKGGISQNHYHYKKIQKMRYPERIKARELVHRAVKSGKLEKLPCKLCGDNEVFAHHNDYSKPLDVEWYCRKHHREQHDNRH